VKRHVVGLEIGFWSLATDMEVSTAPGDVATRIDNDGLLGGLFYRHWFQEDVALTANIGVNDLSLQTDVSVGEVTTSTARLVSFLIGARYYFPTSTRGGDVRPHVGGGIGVFSGSEEVVVAGPTSGARSRTENAVGGRLGVGVDFLPGRHILIGLGAGYNIVADFAEDIGGRRNYSGFEGIVGIGYVFGG
jgi:outer membrane protein W